MTRSNGEPESVSQPNWAIYETLGTSSSIINMIHIRWTDDLPVMTYANQLEMRDQIITSVILQDDLVCCTTIEQTVPEVMVWNWEQDMWGKSLVEDIPTTSKVWFICLARAMIRLT